MTLTSKQRQHLKRLAHDRNPVVIVGDQGLSESLMEELERSLAHHELLKVRVNAGDREERENLIREMTARTASELVQRIGHVAVFYRPAEKPVIQLP